MSQHDLNIANDSGALVRADLNLALVALGSMQTGPLASLPDTQPNMLVGDVTSGHIIKRNSADADWDYLMPIDQRVIESAAGIDTYAITLVPAVNAYKEGVVYRFKADVANTGPATLNINGVAAWGIQKFIDGAYSDLVTGDIIAHHICLAMADTTASKFILLNPSQLTYNAPGYFSRLVVKNNATTPDTQIDVDADVVVVADGSTQKQLLTINRTINCAGTGADGLDAGALGANTWYYIYVISKADGTQSGLASLSATAPTMPADYTFKKLVGAIRTDASSHFVLFNQFGRYHWNRSLSVVLNAGTHSGYIAIDISDVVPPNAIKAMLGLFSNGASTVSCDGVNPFYTIDTGGATTSGVDIPIITPQTIYYSTAGTCSVQVLGFELDI